MFARIGRYLRSRTRPIIIIHIGKCGGSSLQTAISQSDKGDQTHFVHLEKPHYRSNAIYYIVARDPISRCVSAFAWRYKLVVRDGAQRDRFRGEYASLLKHGSLNSLSENLYSTKGKLNADVARDFEAIHHLRERISYYLTDFLRKCPDDKIAGVMMQESLNEDIESHFGIVRSSIGMEKYNHSSDSPSLTPAAKANLVRYIQADYSCLFHLYNIGLIRKSAMKMIYLNALS